MPKIFTLTCNLLAETTLYFNEAHLGRTQRASRSRFRVGGKGVNVAIFLENSGLEVASVIFVGASVGDRCLEFLKSNYKFKSLAIRTNSETREGFVLRDASNSQESTFLGCDAYLSDDDFKAAIELIEKEADAGDILSICGSIPNWSECKFELLKRLLSAKPLRLVVDTYAKPLADLASLKSEILKVNSDEFAGISNSLNLTDASASLESRFKEAALRINSNFFAVTDGGNPAYAYSCGNFYKVVPTRLNCPVYPTGCGDRLLAELLKSLATKGFCDIGDFESAMLCASDFAKLAD